MEKGLSVRKAAALHAVPSTTLRDRVLNHVSVDAAMGPPPVFTKEERAQILEHFKIMGNLGYGYTRQEITDLATDFAAIIGKKIRTDNLTLRWFDKFRRDFPDISSVKKKDIEKSRGNAISEEKIQNYFTALGEVMEQYDLFDKPDLVFNVNDMVVSHDHGSSHVANKEDNPAKSYTVIGCGSASGVVIPPYLIFPGVIMNSKLLENTTPGTDGCVSEAGVSNGQIFRKYLEEHFLKFIPDRNDRHILLIINGISWLISVGLFEWAKERKIIILVLPAQTNHILEPIDVECSGLFKKIYSIDAQKQKGPVARLRYSVASLVSTAYSKAFSSGNLRTAFCKTGIHPFNPDAIDTAMYEQPSDKNELYTIVKVAAGVKKKRKSVKPESDSEESWEEEDADQELNYLDQDDVDQTDFLNHETTAEEGEGQSQQFFVTRESKVKS